MKPGITGWAQVSYGYGASLDDAVNKLDYDLFYIKNMSIFMDLMIVLRTIKIVLSRKRVAVTQIENVFKEGWSIGVLK